MPGRASADVTARRVERPAAVAVVHLPPPMHGMARVSAAVVDALRGLGRGPVAVVNISGWPDRGRVGTVLGALGRILRAARAAGAVVRHRRCGRLYLACDNGEGVAITAILLRLAGRLGYTTYLHHHSLAQIRPPHGPLTRFLVAAARRYRASIVHVGACESMLRELVDAYGDGMQVSVLPLHQMSDVIAPARPGAEDGPLVLGHLCNLSESKGLGRVFDLLDAAVGAGVDARLVVAGPVWRSEDRALLDRRLAASGGRARWVGPVGGEAKSAFFDEIDVFVFPSRYEHESFAIVVAEAQAAGKPVLAYRAGCLDAAVFGEGVHTFDPEDDFAEVAVGLVVGWAKDRGQLERDSTASADRSRSNRAAAQAALDQLALAVLDASGDRRATTA